MKLLSVRHGFATNSSSSHSVVYGSTRERSEVVDGYSGGGNSEFGWAWEEFTGLDSLVNYGLLNFVLKSVYRDGETVATNFGRVYESAKVAQPFVSDRWRANPQFDLDVWKHNLGNIGLQPETLALLVKVDPILFHRGYIDHQSLFSGEGATWEDRLWNYLTTVAIVRTGNDNEDYEW